MFKNGRLFYFRNIKIFLVMYYVLVPEDQDYEAKIVEPTRHLFPVNIHGPNIRHWRI